MSKDFSKLSKEELLTLLKKQERDLRSKQDQKELLRGENKKQAQEIKELKAEKELVAETVGGYLGTAKEVFEQCNRTFAFDISTQKELLGVWDNSWTFSSIFVGQTRACSKHL